jgi:hypothetical protein
MPDDQEGKKKDGLIGESSEDSTEEMDIIKNMFGADDSASSGGDQVFAQNLFGKPEKQEPKAPQRSEEAAPAPAEDQFPTDESPQEISERAAERAGPESGAAPETREGDSSIKIVTDDDLRQLFDQSSPGFRPDQAQPEEPKQEQQSPEAAPAPEAEAEEEAPEAPPEPVSAVPEAPAYGDEDAGAAQEDAPEQSPLEDISPDEIVDQIETRAEVGEMTAVPTAKKGEALDRCAELMAELEPSGKDFMNVAELEKLFHNVDVLIQWARQMSEQMEILEQRLEDLIRGRRDRAE